MVSVKEVVEVMGKKTTRNWTVEQTSLFCSILTDPVTKFVLTLEQKTLKKAVTKEVFDAILEKLKTAFYGRTIQNFKWKVAERIRITQPRHEIKLNSK